MTQLARKFGRFDYFALGCGTTIGVGWLVVIDDWLQRASRRIGKNLLLIEGSTKC